MNKTPIVVETEERDIIDFVALWERVKKKWGWIVVSVLVCLALAVFYLKFATPTYNVTAKILSKSEKDNSLSNTMQFLSETGGRNSIFGDSELEDRIEVIRSRIIVSQFVKQLGLYISYTDASSLRKKSMYNNSPIRLVVPEFLPDTIRYSMGIRLYRSDESAPIRMEIRNQRGEVATVYDHIELDHPFATDYGILKLERNKQFELPAIFEYQIAVRNLNVLAEDYSTRRLSIAPVVKYANVLQIGIEDDVPQRGVDILNKLIELYNQDAIIDKNITFQNTANFIENRLDALVEELEEVETEVENYRKTNNIADIETQASLLLNSSNEYTKRLKENETQQILVQFIEEHLEQEDTQYSPLPANMGFEDTALKTQIEGYNELAKQRQKLLSFSSMESPMVKQLENLLDTERENLLKSVKNVKESLRIREKSIRDQIAQTTSGIKEVPTKEKHYVEIKRLQQVKESLYLFLLQKREETALSLSVSAPVAKIIAPPMSSIKPIAPKKKIVLLGALLLGLGVPLLVFIIQLYYNDSVENLADIERLLNKEIPVLGEIGQSHHTKKIVVTDGSQSSISEMFRIIRTNLGFLLPDEKKVILLTSTISGEGKSFNAANIAASFALLKKKTIIVGLDIRNPQLNQYYKVLTDCGATNYISDKTIKLEDILQKSGENEYLDVITSGTVPPNPSELLLSDRLGELFEILRKQYDYVIVDSAPIGLVTDTLLIQKYCDVTIYVLKQGYSKKSFVGTINKVVEDGKIGRLTVLLNGSQSGHSRYGYYYGYHYGYHKKEKQKKFLGMFKKK